MTCGTRCWNALVSQRVWSNDQLTTLRLVLIFAISTGSRCSPTFKHGPIKRRVCSVPYQRPRRRGNLPANGHGLHRATGSPGSASQNFIRGTKLEFRPTLTIHRRSSPQTRYRQITSRGFGGILNTSNSTIGALALAEVSSFVCPRTVSDATPLGLKPA